MLTAFIKALRGKTVIENRIWTLLFKIHDQAFISMKNDLAHHNGTTMEAVMKGLLVGFCFTVTINRKLTKIIL